MPSNSLNAFSHETLLARFVVVFCACTALLMAGCHQKATDSTVTAAAKSATKATALGGLLEQPVFQCGTSVDSLTADSAPGSVTVFESGPVRPLALSHNGTLAFVTNAPSNCLEIYEISGDRFVLRSSVSVGLEPVAVAQRNEHEVWVVNHLSDSVSVVRLDGTPRVWRTLLVGDEPRDIVFAGTAKERAFVTAAHRGQNLPGFSDQTLVTPGLGRADVWVFDASTLERSESLAPLTIVNLFSDTPRALATSADGRLVYAAAFMSGNQTTTVDWRSALERKAAPHFNASGVPAPSTGVIVKFNGQGWTDSTGKDYSDKVKFNLPDHDVFELDATADKPGVLRSFNHVGTTLFNLATHPSNGQLYVSNLEAKNDILFEGPGSAGSTVRGRIAESRITAIDLKSGKVEPVHLNPHIDFSVPQGKAVPATEKTKSLSSPTSLVVSPDGQHLYVAALGSAKVAQISVETLSRKQFTPSVRQHIAVPDGPAGLAISPDGSRLYVYSRIAHRLSIIDTRSRVTLHSQDLFSPESKSVREGRRILYDAVISSSNGTVSCASCHVFGDTDHLAWDLGDPDSKLARNPNAYVRTITQRMATFHPIKGPMTTQTLRGMAHHGPMHWRGDRTGSNPDLINGKEESLESAAFKEFNPAFVGLLGKERPLTRRDMQAFTEFALSLTPPPNPVRALDNNLSEQQRKGQDLYFNFDGMTGAGSCNTCHVIDPEKRKFGTSGLMSFDGDRINEHFKVPQLRNMYEKVGRFEGGEQIRGFGFLHDGSDGTLDHFFKDSVFLFPAPQDVTRAQVISFVMVADADLAPVVGQQVTAYPGVATATQNRLALLKQQASLNTPRGACDLAVQGTHLKTAYSGLYSDGTWKLRDGRDMTDAQLLALATAEQPATYTCLPPGSGSRQALGR
jgi:DNA-binding beta-propeller fold protein YncE